MPRAIQQIIGNTGGDPEEADTSAGPVVRVSVAVTKSYGDVGQDNGETRWVRVAIFKESIREQVMAKVVKGTRVCVEGVITQDTYNGKPQYSMKASRFGLVDWFLPSDEDKAKTQAALKAKAKPEASDSDDLSW